MIIQNGTIQFKSTPESILDSDGYPVKATEQWSTPVPCQYVPKNINLQDKSGGNATAQRSFEVYVDNPLTGFTEQVRLCDLLGHKIGEFAVISVQELRAVQQIKITI